MLTDEQIDRVLFQIFNTIDMSEVWAFARREPALLRGAVRLAMDKASVATEVPKGADHYRLLMATVDEAESDLAVRANEYVAAMRAPVADRDQHAAEVDAALHALKAACIRRVETFDKVYDALGMER